MPEVNLNLRQKIDLLVYVTSWIAWGFNTIALTSYNWVHTIAPLTYGLFNKCVLNACSVIVASDLTQCGSSWLDAVRAFIIMANIFALSGCIIFLVGRCLDDEDLGKKLDLLAAIVFFVAALFSVIGCSVFTNNGVGCFLEPNAIAVFPHGYGFILAWLSWVLVLVAGVLSVLSYVCTRL